jgi:hypothetical protein
MVDCWATTGLDVPPRGAEMNWTSGFLRLPGKVVDECKCSGTSGSNCRLVEATEGTDAVRDAGLLNGGTALPPFLRGCCKLTAVRAQKIGTCFGVLYFFGVGCAMRVQSPSLSSMFVSPTKNLNENPGQFSGNLRPLTAQHSEYPRSKMKCKVCEHQSKWYWNGTNPSLR